MFRLTALIPDIMAFCGLAYIAFNILRSFNDNVLRSAEGWSFRSFMDWLDPYRQSVFRLKYTAASGIVLVFAMLLVMNHYFNAPKITPQGYTESSIFLNIFTYLPNYLIHEFSHRFAWNITHWQFFTTLAGNLGETFVPLLCIYYLLKLRGGRFLLPLARFWLASTLYDASVYMGDARSCKMALTSSDMVTNYAPGAAKGDWHYIFSDLGLLEYDYVFSAIFCVAACIMLVYAFFSVWHFFAHLDDWNREQSFY